MLGILNSGSSTEHAGTLLIAYTHAPKQDEQLVTLSLDAATMLPKKASVLQKWP